MATLQQRCAWQQEIRQKTRAVYIHTFNSCFIKKKKSQEKIELGTDLKVLAQATVVDNPPWLVAPVAPDTEDLSEGRGGA